MIEGGGLGVFHPDEVGPMHVQVPNGVVDVPVADEAEAVQVAKRYLAYFQGPIGGWECPDQRRLRGIVPESRLRAYDVRAVIRTLADTDSVLELRRHFGLGMVTALVRIEGTALGVVANDPTHLAGAIDRDGADKAARFMQLCDAIRIHASWSLRRNRDSQYRNRPGSGSDPLTEFLSQLRLFPFAGVDAGWRRTAGRCTRR